MGKRVQPSFQRIDGFKRVDTSSHPVGDTFSHDPISNPLAFGSPSSPLQLAPTPEAERVLSKCSSMDSVQSPNEPAQLQREGVVSPISALVHFGFQFGVHPSANHQIPNSDYHGLDGPSDLGKECCKMLQVCLIMFNLSNG